MDCLYPERQKGVSDLTDLSSISLFGGRDIRSRIYSSSGGVSYFTWPIYLNFMQRKKCIGGLNALPYLS